MLYFVLNMFTLALVVVRSSNFRRSLKQIKKHPYLQTRSWLEEDPVWTTIRIRLLMISIILIPLLMIPTIRIRVSVISTRRIPSLMVSASLLWRSSMWNPYCPPDKILLQPGFCPEVCIVFNCFEVLQFV